MNPSRIAIVSAATALALSLTLARIHPFGDAGLYAAQSAPAPVNLPDAPPEVRNVLTEKCADCHSNNPRLPFYGRFAPASWLMDRDIVEARHAMNLSHWNSYTEVDRQTLAAKMAHELSSRQMPPIQYRLIHWNARITDADFISFNQWAHALQAADSFSAATGAGDPIQGKALFEKRCTGCHALNQNREGPQLQGIYGRTSGTAPGFAYSAALKNSHIVWDSKSLDKWLTDPDAFIPGNDMDFQVSKPQDRQDLIAYLRQASRK